MLGEPPHTEYDLKFELFGIPCRVHPFFWLISVLMGLRGESSARILMWVGVIFVSILVHELGHAFVIRYFGWVPRIVLHGFGGLAIHDPNFTSWGSGRRPTRTAQTQILISLAGPAAGFALAAVVVCLLFLTNHTLGYFPVLGLKIPLGNQATGRFIENPNLQFLILQLMYVNIFWGILNLMPIYPLDGGQVARELFLANSNEGVKQSLQLSFVSAIVLAVLALVRFQSQYMAFMFGYLAYLNYQQLNGPFGGYTQRRW